MNKADKAEKTIRRLSKDFYKESWIKYNDSVRGGINYHVDGIKEPIFIPSKLNYFESADIIAKKVVESGFPHYGNCSILATLVDNPNCPISATIDHMVNESEINRIKILSHKEKIIEIKERYNINVT